MLKTNSHFSWQTHVTLRETFFAISSFARKDVRAKQTQMNCNNCMFVKVFLCHKLLPTALFWKSAHPYPLTLNYKNHGVIKKGHSTTMWTKFDPILTTYPPWVDNREHFKYYLHLFTWLSMDFLMMTHLLLHVHVVIECPQRKWVCIFLANGKKKWQGGSSEIWLLMFFRGDVRLEPKIFYLSITSPARVLVTLKMLLAY